MECLDEFLRNFEWQFRLEIEGRKSAKQKKKTPKSCRIFVCFVQRCCLNFPLWDFWRNNLDWTTQGILPSFPRSFKQMIIVTFQSFHLLHSAKLMIHSSFLKDTMSGDNASAVAVYVADELRYGGCTFATTKAKPCCFAKESPQSSTI